MARPGAQIAEAQAQQESRRTAKRPVIGLLSHRRMNDAGGTRFDRTTSMTGKL
jgi:hypothetical protein